jgi:L-alanine-DL-glutamate epimerase-like enolase superfamily enzyme
MAKFGGIGEMMKAVKLAEQHNVSLARHSPIFGPGLIATLPILAAVLHRGYMRVLVL